MLARLRHVCDINGNSQRAINMAFETVDEWKVERSFLPAMNHDWLPSLPTEMPYGDQLQRGLSGGLGTLFSGLFFYFLITAAFNRAYEDGQAQPYAEENTLTMIELSSADIDEPSPETEGGGSEQQSAPAVPSELDTSIETPLPLEWSRTRFSEPRLVSNTAAPSYPTGSGDDSGAGAGQGGGVYDPFAGASPNRDPDKDELLRKPKPQQTLAGRISGFFGFDDAAKQAEADAFEQWVEDLRKRLPRAKGSVLLSVETDGAGKVKSARITGGSASMQVKFFVRNAALGQTFAGLGSQAGKAKVLPVIRLG